MGEILFLAHRIPFPPDRGDKIRSHHLLKALADIAPVHVGCFADTDSDLAHEPLLAEISASHCLIRRRKSMARAGFEALAFHKPVSLTAFDHPDMRAWVRYALAANPIDTIFVFSGQMGQYVPADFAGRVVVDLCDVDSAKFEAYAASGRLPRRWIDAREGVLLATEEARLAQRADRTLLVSTAEAALFRSRIPAGSADKVIALGNGIDAGFFDPQSARPHPDLENTPGPHFVFTGQMDYAPNVAAAQRMISRLLPPIRKIHPGAQFHVVGRAPGPRLMAQDGQGGVRVWGEVPDVRPFLSAADIVIAPLEIARGVQNKVLEAMAMARPVLLTSEAAVGIDAEDGHHFAIADTDDALVARALALLDDAAETAKMAAAARRYVTEHQSWAATLAHLGPIIGKPGPRPDAAQYRDVA
ncbi:TIGR03087 family PEP-CTERM/XrtA system glycosyltransferase [Allopontixanthobacter sp.]|uniref:TIGR03087 family PEP-CTERM/XrtA system glycosyltransferase n=1 Tax=Allopontixanthobacter sp. TaxID=2906452 RepID=UPI002ABD0C07|nr:TIGR03087 family PEP-CTERM/XrtA system glycosyltransferase [Allopontixanthobacter sp.]MDZ4308056.1 TIGR03087 family PEP-CTERM/XrtA system glycosyltransferase [Allopontixanthobacter sp.]